MNTTKIIGKANMGKTKKILFNEVNKNIDNNQSLFILDNNLEYYNYFGLKLKEKGYKIKVINFKNPLNSDGYEPLEYIKYLYNKNKIDLCIEQINEMGLELFKNDNYHGDPFWENSASDYFTGIVLTLLKISDDKSYTFGSLSNLINQGEEPYKNFNMLKVYCNSLDIMDPIYINLSTINNAPVETRGSILSVVKQKLNLFFTRPELLKSFYNNNFKIDTDITDKVAIFVIGYKPLYNLSNILLNQVYSYSKLNNQKITFILDDFDNLNRVRNIESIIDDANKGYFNLYLTCKNEEVLLDKYPKNTFINIEKTIELTTKEDNHIELNNYKLPTLANEKPIYFDFSKYIKNNY